jgi:predicted ribosome quality control (RQC) complex YloA/Tae2 family protein
MSELDLMKALTQIELENTVDYFNELLAGAQLQDILSSDRGLALGFRKVSHYWMILDLVPNAPMFLVFENECPFKKAAKAKPVSLFLNSHGKNRLLKKISVKTELGRVVILELENSDGRCEVEIQLLPKSANVIVRAEGKSIAWEKPQELGVAPVHENAVPARSIEQIHEQWLAEQTQGQKPALDPVAQWEKQRQKDLEKKRKALGEIQKQIDSDKAMLWKQAGDYLKTHRDLNVPEELKSCIDDGKSLSWNIENCFSKAKQIEGKKDGARERLQELLKEIEKLEKARFTERPQKTGLIDLMQKADAKGRKLNLESGAIAYCGKSAADNLALLRQAKAWDYWLHLKDYPGAHGILHRNKDQNILPAELQEVASWVAKESLAAKSLMLGQKVAVVLVECRFVRPIKGDKLGRVTYHSEKTFFFELK